MTSAQMEKFRAAMNIRPGREWDRFEGLREPAADIEAFLERVPFAGAGNRRLDAARIAVPENLPITIQPQTSTQTGFGALLNEIARGATPLAARIVTASPDVTVSTNLGPWVNRRGLFAREALADTFKSERIPSTFTWEFSPKGQHIELGIAEMNLFARSPRSACRTPSTASGCCRSAPCTTRSSRAGSMRSTMPAIRTPASSWWRRRRELRWRPEGGAHQSIAEPLIGMAQDGLAAFEPAFVDELAVILAFALDYIQRDGDG